MNKLRIIALAFCILPLLFGTVALAISAPDSTPTVSNIHVNRYLVEEWDVLIYGDYDIPYAETPNVTASEAFIFRLLDTDGSTELGAISPFALMDKGYNKGVFSFYFPASVNLTWGEAYYIRISQNPSVFDNPTSVDYVIPSSAYTSSTTQEDNQSGLTINIISAATRLENYYTDYDFVEGSASGTVLTSPTGETYFRGVIYGVQAMAPSLFIVEVMDTGATDRTWTTTEFDEYTNRWATANYTWVSNDTSEAATGFGITTPMLMSLVLALPLCIGSIIVSAIKYHKAEAGFVFSSIMLIMVALMGWIPTAIFASLYQAMGIYLAWVWFYSRG